ncbi:hypothetical protein ABK040_002931 [Willaertia magna]
MNGLSSSPVRGSNGTLNNGNGSKVITVDVNHIKKKICINNDSTIQLLFDTVCDKLHITEKKYFALSEQIYDEHNAPIDRFLDFQKTIEGEKITSTSEIKFLAKHIKRPIEFKDPIAEELFYKQIQYNVIKEIYPCSEKLAVLLASISLQITFGDFEPAKHRVGYLNKVGLDNFLPRAVSRHDYAYWQERLFALHVNHKGLSKREAIRKYIELASTIPYFGLTFFEVRDDGGTDLLIGIGEDGIFFFNSQNLKLVHGVPFDCLISWQESELGFDISFEEKEQLHSVSILTTPIKQCLILQLVDEYYALLPDKQKSNKKKPHNPTPILPNDASMYLEPIQRIFNARFSSRLEYLKGYYMECCALGKETPIKKFYQDIDRAIDNNEILRNIDWSYSGITDSNITFFTKSIMKTLDYKQDKNFPWKEDLEIETIDLSGNNIRQGLAWILDLLIRLKKTKGIDLSNSPVGDNGAMELTQSLTTSDIRTIKLENCEIGNKGFQAIFEMMKWKKNARSLMLGKNLITSQYFSDFAKFLDSNTSLVELDLSYNSIDSKGIEMVIKSIENNRKIQKLNLSGNILGPKTGLKIASLVEVNHTIKELRIAETKITGEVLVKLGRACRTNRALEVLDISGNIIGKNIDKNLIHEAWFFLSQENAVMKELNIAGNGIDAIFGEVFVDSMRLNKSLTILDVSNNNMITKNGSLPEGWNEAIRKCTSLEVVKFSNCGLKASGFLDILSAVSSNPKITELHIGDNDPKEGLKGFSTFLTNARVKALYLNNLKITDDIFEKIGIALEINQHLEHLYLNNNEITKNGIFDFISHIGKKNSTLTTLNISNNTITEEEKVFLSKNIEEKTNIDKVLM